jgi:type VI protein secretion system component Hcp
MDASDVLRRIKAQTQYNYKLSQVMISQPKVNISSCVSEASTLRINYTNYDQRFDIALGKLYANNCSTSQLVFLANSG